MTRTSVAALRRANRLMRPARLTKATRSFQKAMAGLMAATILAPLTPRPVKPRRTAAPKGAGAVFARMPKGAQFLTRTHRSAAGARGYRLYLPASRPKRPKGLIVMLHGCNQTPDDFARGTHMNALAEKHGLAIAYPGQTMGNNGASCWNWFRPGDQARGAGEPALLASLTRKLMKEMGLRRDVVFVAGLSAGGAMAAILVDVYPDIFSAAGVHSGLARGAAHDVMSAMSAMRSGGGSAGIVPVASLLSHPVRRIVFHGDTDSTVHPSNASDIVAAALGHATAPTSVNSRSVRGRSYERSNFAGTDGRVVLELWMLERAGHAWSGGRAAGSYTDSKGPDASAQMIRFFLAKPA